MGIYPSATPKTIRVSMFHPKKRKKIDNKIKNMCVNLYIYKFKHTLSDDFASVTVRLNYNVLHV